MKIFKKLLKKTNEGLTVIIVIGIIIAVNFLSYQIFSRFDLTEGGDYSISPATKNTVGKLDDVVLITGYFSRNLPPKYANLEQEVKDVLAEYANYSNGKIKIKIVDPAKVDNAAEVFGQKGIPTLQFNVLKNDSFQVVNGYLGLTIEYGGKSEVIPVVDSTSNLEYELTLTIKKLVAGSMPVLGIVTSHGSLEAQKMAQAQGRLKQLYALKSVDLTKDEKVPEEVSALMLIGLKQKLSDAELKKIDAFAMKGRPVIFLIDGVSVDPQTGAVPNEISLEKLLVAYGVDIRHDLIADESNGRASFSSGGSYYLTYQVNYPLWPKLLPENFDQDNVMISDLSSIILPWASSLDIKELEGAKITVLAKSTAKAISQVGKYDLEPDTALSGGQELKQYPLAALITGKISSPLGQGSTDNAKIVVVGDSDFVSDMFSGPVSDNLAFFQNLADGLALDSDLINIRSKGTVERPIKPLSFAAKEVTRYLNVFLLAMLALIFGFIRYFLRRRFRAVETAASETSKGKLARIKQLFIWLFGLFGVLLSWLKKVAVRIKSLKKNPPAEVANSPASLSSDDSAATKEAYKDIKN